MFLCCKQYIMPAFYKQTESFIFLILFCNCSILAQNTVNYSPAFFGPNADPVAEFTGARIPKYTTFEVSGDYFYGYGDRTVNPEAKVEIPLLSQRISLKVWIPLWERYSVTQALYDERQMEGNLTGTTTGGDFYVQTRILALAEKKYLPAVVINATIKTASGEQFPERRYFNTPGYYFDAEIAKSFSLNNKIVSNIRVGTDWGFLCWETTNSRQDDAFMYGGTIILSNKALELDNTIAGYDGRLKDGDMPFVYSAKLIGNRKNLFAFIQYKYGIRDWHYQELQLGVGVKIKALTPKFGSARAVTM